ncbi:MAG: hypothetical protein DSZ01_00710 [Gammaproteobacteria bacterium]|nr:MAG: hypothetical protein DSZ01_00710 [Gammaproteobacteria bacterium]
MPLFRHLIVPTLALALASVPAFAEGISFPGNSGKNTTQVKSGKTTVCHNGNTISISNSALQAHLAHGDTKGPCPAPRFTSVVILRCLNTNGQILISGVSGSDNADVDLPLPRQICANGVARMMNAGFHLQQVSTGLTGGETEYLFLGNSESR